MSPIVLCGLPLLASAALAVEPEWQAVPLTVTTSDKPLASMGSGGFAFVPLDAQGQGSIVFADAPGGHLRLRCDEGGRVQVDSDLDGKLTEADAWAKPQDQALPGMHMVALPLVLDGRRQDMMCSLQVQNFFSTRDRYVIIYGLSQITGTYQGTALRLCDQDLDGRFDGATDRLIVTAVPGRELRSSLKGRASLGAQVVQVRWSEGQRLSLAPLPGPMAQATPTSGDAAWSGHVAFIDENGSLRVEVPWGSTVCLPAGRFRMQAQLAQAHQPPSDKKVGFFGALLGRRPAREMEMLVFQGEDQAGDLFDLLAGPQAVKVGPPFTLDFKPLRIGDQVAVLGVSLVGAGGERYRAQIDAAKVTWKLLRGDHEQAGGTLEYG